MEFYVNEFKNHLINEKKVSDNTFSNYLRDVLSFLSFKNYDSFPSGKDVEVFEDFLIAKGKSKSTVSRVNASLRCYFSFLNKSNLYAEKPPIKTLSVKLEDKQLPEILTVMEVEKLLNAPDTTTYKGIRDRAILEVLYATGIKPTELIELKLSNVNIKLNYIKLTNDKKERILPMYDEAVEVLNDYIKNARNFLSEDNCDALFLNMNGSALTRQGLWKIIKQNADNSGIKKEITPNILRHSFAVHLMENGAAPNDVKEIMGFNDISSTKIYSQIFKTKYAKNYNRFHPLAKKIT